MKITDIINNLEELKSEYGDIPVVIEKVTDSNEDPKFVEVEHLITIKLVGETAVKRVVLLY